MIVELMRPAGPDLVRRWVAALLAAPADQREAIVESVEQRIAELYPHDEGLDHAPEVTVKTPSARTRSAG